MTSPITSTRYTSGFAVLIGRSNVGKSTLINSLVGSKVAITTPKPQTTRFPISGIISRPEGQVVIIDTPGVLKQPKDALAHTLMASVKDSLKDVDVVLYVVDPTRSIGEEEKAALKLIEQIEKPKILVINKIDGDTPYKDYYLDLAPSFTEVVEVSALRGTHVKHLADRMFSYLPEGEAYYPEGQLTNLGNEQWTAELIREKLFLRLRKEIPYTIHVEVDAIERRENGVVYIHATIFTTDERYKRIIIGSGGRGIKEIGQSTRKELEMVMQTPIFLDLNVDVDPSWMNKFES